MKKTYSLFLSLLLLLSACSSTKSIPEGDQLFTGVKSIHYTAEKKDTHFNSTKEEVDAALATAPNGNLFGSGIRSPFPVGLWVWNAFTGNNDPFAKWMLKSFGTNPVLMSWVNPGLRAQVAKLVLQAHGYFRSNVGYEILKQSNPKEAKVSYEVNMGHLFTIDSLRYIGFPPDADSLRATQRTRQKSTTVIRSMSPHLTLSGPASAPFSETTAISIISRPMLPISPIPSAYPGKYCCASRKQTTFRPWQQGNGALGKSISTCENGTTTHSLTA